MRRSLSFSVAGVLVVLIAAVGPPASATPQSDSPEPGDLIVASSHTNAILGFDSSGDFRAHIDPRGGLGVETWSFIERAGVSYAIGLRAAQAFNAGTGEFLRVFEPLSQRIPFCSTFGPTGDLYIGDDRGAFWRFDASTGALINEFISSNELTYSFGAEFGPDGDFYAADSGGRSIRRFDGATGDLIETFITLDSGVNPLDVAFAPSGHFLVLLSTSAVFRYDLNGAFLDEFIPASTAPLSTRSMSLDSAGNVFLSGGRRDENNVHFGVVFEYDGLDGTFRRTAIAVTDPDVSLYLRDAVITADTIRVIEAGYSQPPEIINRIAEYGRNTGDFIGEFIPLWNENQLAWPADVVVGPDGLLYVSTARSSVHRWDPATKTFLGEFVPSGSGGLRYARGLAFDTNGTLYVTDDFYGSIRRYDGRTGEFLGAGFGGDNDFGSGSPAVRFRDGMAWKLDGAGNVNRYDEETGDPLGEFIHGTTNDAQDLDFLPNGDVLVLYTSLVRRYEGTTGDPLPHFITSGSGGMRDPYAMQWGPDGDLYITSRETHSVLRYHGETGAFIDEIVPRQSAGLTWPTGLAFVPEDLPMPAMLLDANVSFGQHLSGGIPELLETDDTYLRARSQFGFAASEPNLLEIRFGFATDQIPAQDFLGVVESRINTPGGQTRWRLRNWITNAFETVWEHQAATSDAMKSLALIEAANRVRQSDGRIEFSWRTSVIATFSAAGFTASLDLVRVSVRPQ